MIEESLIWFTLIMMALAFVLVVYGVLTSGGRAMDTVRRLELTEGECEAIAAYWARRKGGRDDICNDIQIDTGSGRADAGCGSCDRGVGDVEGFA